MTRNVAVNGVDADYDPARGQWTIQDFLNAGAYTVEARDAEGRAVGRRVALVSAGETLNAVDADITSDAT
ncbi:hypothetical protein HS125_01005 [bacterium]|nr:hypothetical protein [bacterium]